MELVATRQGYDKTREEAPPVNAREFLFAACDRLRGSHRARHHSAAQSRRNRARRSLHLHGFRARRSAWLRSRLGERRLLVCREADGGFLFPRATRRRDRSHRVRDRKSTRLNSSHMSISYAVFCLKKKKI